MRKLTLVRHGETDENRAHRLQGRSDTVLNQTGMQQAERVALALRGESLTAIWTSPLKRAHDTARCISQYHQCALDIRNELIERSFGDLEGLPHSELVKREASATASLYDFCPPNAESFAQLEARANNLLNEIRTTRSHHLVLVGHAGLFRALIGALLSYPFERWFEIPQSNTCINQFQFNADGSLAAYQINDTAHCV